MVRPLLISGTEHPARRTITVPAPDGPDSLKDTLSVICPLMHVGGKCGVFQGSLFDRAVEEDGPLLLDAVFNPCSERSL